LWAMGRQEKVISHNCRPKLSGGDEFLIFDF
jgi:hypothetical protein